MYVAGGRGRLRGSCDPSKSKSLIFSAAGGVIQGKQASLVLVVEEFYGYNDCWCAGLKSGAARSD